MRQDIKKFLFVGLKKEKNYFFKRAQEAGIIHFISDKPMQLNSEAPEEVNILSKAITILRGLIVAKQEEFSDLKEGISLAKGIVSIKESLEKLYEEQRMLALELARVAPFGDFCQKKIASIENEASRKIQFYCAKKGFAEKDDLSENVIYVSSDHGLDYFFAINKQATQYPHMIEIIIDKSWGELKQQEYGIKKEIHTLEHDLKDYAKYNRFLHQALVHEMNEFHLKEAKHLVNHPIDGEDLFVIQGWAPINKMNALQILENETNVFIEEVAIDSNEIVPSFLENKGFAQIGEDLVHIYDTPSSNDKDPSLWVLAFFALFFSMIIGDSGYGLVLLLIASYIRYKHAGLKNHKKTSLRSVNNPWIRLYSLGGSDHILFWY